MRSQRTDARLVRAALGGDGAARAELVRRHAAAAWRAAYGVTGRHDLADDAAQDGMLRALDRLDTFDETRPFAPWLHRVVVHVALRAAQREHRSAQVAVPTATPASAVADPAAEPLRDAVLALPDDQREIVALRYWADLGVDEIATVLDVPSGTVASRLSRALARLRTELEMEAS